MSPIPTLAAAATLLIPGPSTVIDPGLPSQPASTMSQYLVGTGGFLFAVVAVISLARYFYHGRGAANATQKSNHWSVFLSFIRQLGSTKTSTAASTHCSIQLETNPEHVSMVYARFFHPTFWSLVECHPATPSAPAIYVEEEAKEVPNQDPKPFGMDPFPNMDENDGDKCEKDSTTPSREKPNKVTKARVEQVPPYDTSSPTIVNFVSQIIGTTIRPDGFLCVPGQDEDDPSEGSDSDSDFDFASLAYDGIATAPLILPPDGRRHGMADMRYLAESLKDALLEEGPGFVSTVSFRTKLTDISELMESDPVFFCTPLGRRRTMDNSATDPDPSAAGPLPQLTQVGNLVAKQIMDNRLANSECDIGSSDDRSSITSLDDVETLGVPHSSVDLMEQFYGEYFKAVDDTLMNSESDVAVCEGYDVGSMPYKPLRRLGKANDDSMAPDFDVSIYDGGHHIQSGSNVLPSFGATHHMGSDAIQTFPSEQSADIEPRSSDIDTLEGPEELEDLMSEIYDEYFRSVDDAMTLKCDVDVCGCGEGTQIDSWDVESIASCTPLHLLGAVDDGSMASDCDVGAHDNRCHTQSDSSYVTTSSPTAYHEGLNVMRSIPSKQPVGDSDHDNGCYDNFEDNLSDINTLEVPEDLEDLWLQIYAEFLYWSESVKADTMASNCNIVRDGCTATQISPSNADALRTPDEDPDLMRRILIDLRDPGLDFSPRDISEDTGSEYNDNGGGEGNSSRNFGRNSLESGYFANCTPDSDVSDEGSIYPLTPPPMSPNVLDNHMASPDTPGFRKEVQVVPSLTMFSSPASLRESYFLGPYLDCRPPDASDDSHCQHSNDTEEKANNPRLRPPWGPHNERQSSLDCASSNTGTDCDVLNKGLASSPTPPSITIPVASAPDTWKGHMSVEIPLVLVQEAQVVSPLSCHSPPALPTKAYIPSHRNSRSSMYGPRLPLLDLPRI